MDKSRTQFEPAIEFVSNFNDTFYQTISHNLGTFIEDGFLKDLFEKNLSTAVDKAQLLIESTFCFVQVMGKFYGDVGDDDEDDEDDSSDDEQFEQDAAEFSQKINELRSRTPKPVVETPPILPDVEMTPVDQTVTPETSQKKNKQKAHVTDDKQIKNQSTTAKPDAKTSAKNSQRKRNHLNLRPLKY
ncbi:hypothetical protein RhiirA4_483165 [Rhizophagus irregularis]|uniref:Uncharacterized protein n=1 Tax=Rhizophagus irregularis TaxID=588596 RepID=A0A2I1HM68_9GLOM|nr:hypothetical protein RhiirA4_483165 [Rhizophagus irregularis]